ncbi:MAG: prolipoprotein diacylglyceryl transferase [Bacteroidetes bacterium 4572_128]|nr:MAG: prolipoprotein diacylglyceryl transferase [Bacteroidetes bacterium 4572_128]
MFLNYIIWEVSPEIFSIGSFGVRWYSLFFATGIFLSYLFMSKIYKKEGLNLELLDKLSVYVVLGIILGARLGHCLFYETSYYLNHPLEIFLPWRGSIFGDDFNFTGFRGLASHGAVIGILTSLFLYTRKYKIDYLWILDRLVIVSALSGAFVRLGNLMNSEIVGKKTDFIFAFIFKRIDEIPRHPAQVYESICYFIIFIGLYFYFKKYYKNFSKGNIFSFFLIFVFLTRFILEFFKENQEVFEESLFINMGQILSIPFILIGISIFIRNKFMKNLN